MVAVAADLYAADLSRAELAEAHARLLAGGGIPTSYDGTPADLAALKDMTSRLIGRTCSRPSRTPPVTVTGRPADPVPRRPRHPRRDPGRVRRAQGGRRALRDVRPGAAGGDVRPARGGAPAREALLASPRSRLDPIYRIDFDGAADDAAALRAVVDQVASLTDARALLMHRQWC